MIEYNLNNIPTVTLNNELNVSVDVENYDQHQIYAKPLRNYNNPKRKVYKDLFQFWFYVFLEFKKYGLNNTQYVTSNTLMDQPP